MNIEYMYNPFLVYSKCLWQEQFISRVIYISIIVKSTKYHEYFIGNESLISNFPNSSRNDKNIYKKILYIYINNYSPSDNCMYTNLSECTCTLA